MKRKLSKNYFCRPCAVLNQNWVKTLVLFVLIVWSFSAVAQQISPFSINPLGGVAQQSGTLLSWTLGEVCGPYLSHSEVNLSQGFQQSTVRVIGIENPPNTNKSVSITVFPNPVSEKLSIQIKVLKPQPALIQLFDATGSLVSSYAFNLTSGTTAYSIPVSHLAAQLLLLKVILPKEKTSATFRVIKGDGKE